MRAIGADGKTIELAEVYSKPACFEAAVGFVPLDVLLNERQKSK